MKKCVASCFFLFVPFLLGCICSKPMLKPVVGAIALPDSIKYRVERGVQGTNLVPVDYIISNDYGSVIILQDSSSQDCYISYINSSGEIFNISTREFQFVAKLTDNGWYQSTYLLLSSENSDYAFDSVIQIDTLGSGIMVFPASQDISTEYSLRAIDHSRSVLQHREHAKFIGHRATVWICSESRGVFMPSR